MIGLINHRANTDRGFLYYEFGIQLWIETQMKHT
jgi:hypothetical protein